jgi:hypothetical protein
MAKAATLRSIHSRERALKHNQRSAMTRLTTETAVAGGIFHWVTLTARTILNTTEFAICLLHRLECAEVVYW